MAKVVGIGKQRFDKIIENDCFYIDKTMFIKEWWENQDDVTLITRPRRFGKTLNMDMLKCFFSVEYKDRGELFEGLDIWKEKKYREIQGTYPVIFMSFAGIKSHTFRDAKNDMVAIINETYKSHAYLLESDILSEAEKNFFKKLDEYSKDINANKNISSETIYRAINNLSCFLNRYYKKNVIILLDEYDTPMQEAYVHGYWDEIVAFTRSFFNYTFKTNPYLERAIMTGITRVSKESIFSDLNNLLVVTTTSEQYEIDFGFTEEEVFLALDKYELSEKKQSVKEWYDGFTFGNKNDIYNPWSILNFIKVRKFGSYWADSSSNGLVNKLVKTGSPNLKKTMEILIEGGVIEKRIDEQIVYNQLEKRENAVWSLLLASGYLRVVKIRYEGDFRKRYYTLKLTNKEVEQMFEIMIEEWFDNGSNMTGDFIEAMLAGDLYAMNSYMNDIALDTFSSFDVAGKEESRIRPEDLASCYDCKGVANGLSLNDSSNLYAMTRKSSRFYHGFVLGLMVDKREDYIIKSNKESGFGRYDVMMIPRDTENSNLPGLILEFKVINHSMEKSLEETVKSALQQIEEKKYDTELLKAGVKKENIRHYGFAFEGKKVLIGTDE